MPLCAPTSAGERLWKERRASSRLSLSPAVLLSLLLAWRPSCGIRAGTASFCGAPRRSTIPRANPPWLGSRGRRMSPSRATLTGSWLGLKARTPSVAWPAVRGEVPAWAWSARSLAPAPERAGRSGMSRVGRRRAFAPGWRPGAGLRWRSWPHLSPAPGGRPRAGS
eukprot:13043322-Alexandrium_andersonii.AAC.1